MDKLNAIHCFIAIAEQGSLTEAARRLGKSLPTVVRTLATLEDQIETRLFNRTTRHVALTEEGRQYLDQCRRLLTDLEEVESHISGRERAPSGLVTLSAPLFFGELHVAPIVQELSREHSSLSIRLALSDRIENLIERHIDFAVRIGHLSDSTLTARTIGHVRQSLCASPEFLQTRTPPDSPRALRDQPCIRIDGNDAGRSWPFQSGAKPISVPVDGGFTCNTVRPAVAACEAGLGYGLFLSYQVKDALRAGRLVELLADHQPPPLPVQLVRAATPTVPGRVRTVWDRLARDLARRL